MGGKLAARLESDQMQVKSFWLKSKLTGILNSYELVKIPKFMCTEIDRTNGNFFLNNNKIMDIKSTQCPMQTIAYNKICRPKSEWGLGVKQLEDVCIDENITRHIGPIDMHHL